MKNYQIIDYSHFNIKWTKIRINDIIIIVAEFYLFDELYKNLLKSWTGWKKSFILSDNK